MKKLLFSASILVLFSACDPKTDKSSSESLPSQELESAKMENTPAEKDTLRIATKKGEVVGHSETDGTLNETENTEAQPKQAPKHNAPDQSAIDSIKAAKQKGKK